MRGYLEETPFDRPLSHILKARPEPGTRLVWLGQAGFVVEAHGKRIVIDPYLSDSLARKYRGTERPHIRMMPAPVTVEEMGCVDLVLCTHAHTDHMDPETLQPLLHRNPGTFLVAPRAVRSQAMARAGVAEERLILLSGGETATLGTDIRITATRAAHEAVETDPSGNHRFLGYVFDFGDVRFWHSGDCVPFPGLEDEVRALRPDIALLPVNGRRPDLSQSGIAGNFNLDEAIAISRSIACREMVAHHYGLFDFNTEKPDTIDAAAKSAQSLKVHRARQGIAFTWTTI
ncbi:MAG: MBL fold metallo-hydrolase [Alphaproteobacteria bacterium]